ncbi:hypothetical protein ACNOYE_18725 [Nannocystaceae bacterium ST9]
MNPITTPSIQYALVLAGCMLLGLWLRSEQVAHASGPVCDVRAKAELVEVRRVEGNGDLASQQAIWHQRLSLRVSSGGPGMLSLYDETLPEEMFSIEMETP